jgi:hypothetical protein
MKTKYDWSNVPDEVKWIATDSNMRTAGGYTRKPKMLTDFWCLADSTLTQGTSYIVVPCEPYQGNWQDSLEERPQ